jgi:hypothetical protein
VGDLRARVARHVQIPLRQHNPHPGVLLNLGNSLPQQCRQRQRLLDPPRCLATQHGEALHRTPRQGHQMVNGEQLVKEIGILYVLFDLVQRQQSPADERV